MANLKKYSKPVWGKHKVKEYIDNILDCVFYIDKGYNIQGVNHEALIMLGYKEPQIMGKRFDFVLGRDFSSQWEDFCKFLTKWPVRNHDVIVKKRYGRELPVKMNFTPLSNNKGGTEGWFITAKDMSPTRSLIRELARSRKELQHTVKELEESRDELIRSEKLSFAGRMAASVAHEIRNPLNIIGMAVQQLHNELGKKDKRREYTKMIIGHIDRVDKLITEFVSVARPPRIKLKWKNINMILEDVVKLMKAKFQEHRAKVTAELDKELPKIRVDEEHVTQAFTNMLLNACDALPKRGGKVNITSERDNNNVLIKVRNTGKPIAKKDLIRIFDPFFSTKKGGTGLGMSIAYGVIGSHRGTIGIESNERLGTVFTVRLPI